MMTAKQIMDEVKAVEELSDGDAMYYDPHSDEVVMGQDGCQPSNTCCLRVGPDHIDNIDLGEIETGLVEMLEHWGRN